MHIKFVEIQNFRKLKSVRIEFAETTTLFVGANNSGKTSVMDALRLFLIDKKLSTIDFTLSNWNNINEISEKWIAKSTDKAIQVLSMDEWVDFLPSLDIWVEVADNEIHHVSHLLPTLDWESGCLGVRLRFEPKSIEDLYKEFLTAYKTAKDTVGEIEFKLWPQSIREFLDKKLGLFFTIRAYTLDPDKRQEPENGLAKTQPISDDHECLDMDAFKELIKIHRISAQRGFSDPDNSDWDNTSDGQKHRHGNLSAQLRTYYNKHIDPSELPDASDLDVLQAIETAQKSFDKKLSDGFASAINELEGLGYPGFTDPTITISTQIRPIDSISHSSAVQFEVIKQQEQPNATPLRLPEQYNGLGYQNLISMVFQLMRFRDEWMQVGKVEKRSKGGNAYFEPLHFVMIEEPEAHLHAQVQQVFIRKAYEVLRNHDRLKDAKDFTTQLIVSTHSSNIAHECDFSSLRYFRRMPAPDTGHVPTSSVVNLSRVFGTGDDTQRFATRYLKTTHCDLFFADAAILVEGPAERMLVPHFIAKNFEKLNQSYISLLEIGGSHAHRLRPLIEELGLITLIITDLDATVPTNNNPAVQPKRNKGFKTGNSTMKTWIPELENVEELLDLAPERKIKEYPDQSFSVRVAYQFPVNVNFPDSNLNEALPNTFEDALVFENLELFRGLDGIGLIKKFKKVIGEKKTTEELGQAMFEALHETSAKKAAFALELLWLKELNLENSDSEDTKELKIPTYIEEGLKWLENCLCDKEDMLTSSVNSNENGVEDAS